MAAVAQWFTRYSYSQVEMTWIAVAACFATRGHWIIGLGCVVVGATAQAVLESWAR